VHRATLILAVALATSLPLPSVAASQGPHPLDPRVDSVFAQWDRPDSPGCAVGVYRGGRIVHARGYGLADLERRVPITTRSMFDIGSTSKQFAAASIVLLAQQGKLTLDDDVRRHVPELPDYGHRITIRHLLNHTSGLRDYIGLLTLGGASIDGVTTDEDALAAIARQRALNFEPGTAHLYSNSGYFLLSTIVERAAGKSLRDFAREQIFQPLGMERTHYLGSYDDIVPDRALAYSPRQGGYRTDMSRWLQLGDGAVWTNVEELLLWDSNFYEPRVGGRAMLDDLHRRGRLASGDSVGYALGLAHTSYRGQPAVSHGGAWGGYRADLLRFPEQRYSVAVLCNVGSAAPSTLARRVADIHLADVLEPRPATAPPTGGAQPDPAVSVPEEVLRQYVGAFRSATLPEMRVSLEQGKLFLSVGSQRFELRPHGDGRFTLVNAPVGVRVAFFTPSDGPATLQWEQGTAPPATLTRVELVTPSAADLVGLAGSYFSEELQATITVSVSGDTLSVRRPGAPVAEFRPGVRDEFVHGGLALRFTRDQRRQVTGFLLDEGRARGIVFEKRRNDQRGPERAGQGQSGAR
jgi:CubicO group peptidase (beta-lactamase class C family)